MHERHGTEWDAVIQAVTVGPGSLSQPARVALLEARDEGLPHAQQALARKVQTESFKIGDADVAGMSDDAFFETVIVAALSAGASRLRRCLSLLDEVE